MALPINKFNPDVQWKIYYHDPDKADKYFTYSNLDGRAANAPIDGVICIIQPVEGGRYKETIASGDHYAMDEEGRWVTFMADGLQERIDNNIPYNHLKNGRWISTERYQEIRTRAYGDVDFGGNGKFTAVER